MHILEAYPREPRSHPGTLSCLRNRAQISRAPPYCTVKPDYLEKDTPLAVGVIEGNQKRYFVGDRIEHSLLFHHYQKEQVHFW